MLLDLFLFKLIFVREFVPFEKWYQEATIKYQHGYTFGSQVEHVQSECKFSKTLFPINANVNIIKKKNGNLIYLCVKTVGTRKQETTGAYC